MTECAATLSAFEASKRLKKHTEKLSGIDGYFPHADELVYCSWPEAFGSAAGPFGGIGGQAITNFRMEAWCWETFAVVFCGGKGLYVGEFRIGAEWRKR